MAGAASSSANIDKGFGFTLGRNGRRYYRAFDWELARQLYADDVPTREIARIVGASPNAVLRVVDPQFKQQIDARTREWTMSGVCPGCGKQGTVRRSADDPGSLCRDCWHLTRHNPDRHFRLDEQGEVSEARCGRCRQWKPIGLFPPRVRELRRIYGLRCTSCESAARAAFRDRRKVPCVRCGQPRTHPADAGGRAGDTGLCRDCYQQRHQHTHPHVAAEVDRPPRRLRLARLLSGRRA